MKNQIYLMAFVCIAIISSCKKNDDNSPNNNNNPAVNNLSNIVGNGSWRVSYFHESNSDHTSNYSGYTFTFSSNGTMTATNQNGTTNGTWNLDDSSNEFHMSLGNSSPLKELSKGWLIITQTSTAFDLKDDDLTHNEELHFTKI